MSAFLQSMGLHAQVARPHVDRPVCPVDDEDIHSRRAPDAARLQVRGRNHGIRANCGPSRCASAIVAYRQQQSLGGQIPTTAVSLKR